MKLAFVGLGAMGEPMAANLLKKGFAVTIVGNRRPEPVERLQALGATVAASAGDAAAASDVVVLMLPGTAEVRHVALDAGGLADRLRRGACVIDCSTSDPHVTREIATALHERGIDCVDAPVTRGVAGAKDGKLAFFIGGETDVIARVQPLLAAMGDTFLHMGGIGNGHVTKIIVQALSYATVGLVNEALMSGASAGIDLGALQQALLAGAGSKALESFGPRIVERQIAKPRVVVADARRHLDIALRLMRDAGAVRPIHAAAAEALAEVAARGHERDDLAALGETWPEGVRK